MYFLRISLGASSLLFDVLLTYDFLGKLNLLDDTSTQPARSKSNAAP